MTAFTLAHVFMRSLLIQGTWNFERMHSQGLTYAVMPALREIYGDGPQLKAAVERYMEFFSTHPYMSAPMIGAMLRIEEEQPGEGADQVRIFKQRMMGIGGALGDPFYWRALRPFSGIVGVALAWWGALWAPLVSVAIYNAVHLPMRVRSFTWGYRDGPAVVQRLRDLNLPTLTQRLRDSYFLIAAGVGGAWAGGFIGDGPTQFEAFFGVPAAVFPLVTGGAVLFFHGLLRRGGPAESIIYVSLIVVLLVAYLAAGRGS